MATQCHSLVTGFSALSNFLEEKLDREPESCPLFHFPFWAFMNWEHFWISWKQGLLFPTGVCQIMGRPPYLFFTCHCRFSGFHLIWPWSFSHSPGDIQITLSCPRVPNRHHYSTKPYQPAWVTPWLSFLCMPGAMEAINCIFSSPMLLTT